MAPKSRAANGVSARNEAQIRQHISAEAARIMSAEGVRDYHTAKRKAALRLNLPDTKNLPSNQEVETALREYLHLFHAERLSVTLRRLRELALEAMHFFASFDPRLVGSVLSGTVTPESAIQLHIYADTPEEIGLLLHEHNIPFQETDRRLRYGGDRQQPCPVYRFTVDASPIEVFVFGREGVRERPLSPVDGRPMKRASIKDVEDLRAHMSARAWASSHD
ncbi:MAG: hypothetical protein ACE5LB_03380 [Acidiferrobacterales bacterium]